VWCWSRAVIISDITRTPVARTNVSPTGEGRFSVETSCAKIRQHFHSSDIVFRTAYRRDTISVQDDRARRTWRRETRSRYWLGHGNRKSKGFAADVWDRTRYALPFRKDYTRANGAPTIDYEILTRVAVELTFIIIVYISVPFFFFMQNTAAARFLFFPRGVAGPTRFVRRAINYGTIHVCVHASVRLRASQ
jgi:hypothetical protein